MTTALTRFDAATWRARVDRRRRGGGIELDGESQARLDELFGRRITAAEAVEAIVTSVREGGDALVREWTRRIDGIDVAKTLVAREEPAAAWASLDRPLQSALQLACERIRTFHEAQRGAALLGTPDLGLRSHPLRRAGCYVPGGRAAYPSTVLMSVIPAQVAGVGSIAVASPPGPDGRVHRSVLAAAHLLGVGELHAMGGAQAVAALAHGTESVARVDKIVGPGNVFVSLAKRAVFGQVGIDGVAGPSEVLIIAADGADPAHVAADMVSQLEHDPMAWAVCITDSSRLARLVEDAFTAAAAEAHRAGIIDRAAGGHGAVVLCRDMDEACELSDGFAPEHLELQGAAAEALADRPLSAGALFVGDQSPVSMGDYIAGPNHTLPTGGAARFTGPLSVMDFVRWTSVTRLSRADMRRLGPPARRIAEAEGLHGHSAAIGVRLEDGSGVATSATGDAAAQRDGT